MKTALKLVLIYFAMQVLGALATMPLMLFYTYFTYGNLNSFQGIHPAPALFAGMLLMILYLWKHGYMRNDGRVYSVVSASAVVWGLLATVSIIFLTEALMSVLPLPDLLENTFDDLQKTWLGLFCIAVFGPLLEELLFRGAITRVLLERYSPLKAILLSGIIFGVFHINPVQVIGATFFGFFAAWLYYRTRSIIPGLLGHIFNNALSVYLSLTYPEAEYMSDLMDIRHYGIFLLACALLLAFSCYVLHVARFPQRKCGGEAY